MERKKEGEKREDVIAIDGPSGVGKSTVSRRIAKKMGYTYLDTGTMYRAVGLYLHQKAIPFDNHHKTAVALKEMKLRFIPTEDDSDIQVEVNGSDISTAIRTPEVSMLASQVSSLPEVRNFLTTLQRQYGKEGKIVAEGRDMGSVVFPNAAWKFYLDASAEVRAKRRFAQLVEQGKMKGEKEEFMELFAQINQRDRQDSERSLAPLTKASDAIAIDSSALDIDGVVAIILGYITA